jgi:hypothetical protein
MVARIDHCPWSSLVTPTATNLQEGSVPFILLDDSAWCGTCVLYLAISKDIRDTRTFELESFGCFAL